MKHIKFIGVRHKLILLLSLSISLVSCKKNTAIAETPTPEEKPIVPIPTPPQPSVPDNAVVYMVGTGSGSLVIDGSTLNLADNSIIKISGGTYKSIAVRNINGKPGKTVFVKNEGQVIITESMNTENLNNVTISGDNVAGMPYGIKFEDIKYMALTMGGKMSGVTLKSLSFKNVSNYVIAGQSSNGSELNYDQTSATRTESFKILNCLFENVGSIVFGGKINKTTGQDNGLFKDVEIAYNIFRDSPGVGSVALFTNVQDYDIHHNVVTDINQGTNNHNGVFSMIGNGKFHDNKLSNYQGNAIRMWLFSRGANPVTCEIYNNVCYNTRKYSGFELQGFDEFIFPGRTSFANAKVYNNTVGKMNTSKDWEGQLLDLYNYNGGSLEYYNNLGFDLNTNGYFGMTNMINNNSDVKFVVERNNKYVQQQDGAVSDVIHFVSKITGIGAVGF